ncbi:MAG: YeeE/YedE family protein [Pseudomonadota bacterium]
MTTFTPIAATIGGALIGLAAVLLMWLNGRIAGISGILQGAAFSRGAERSWRLAFVAGLVLGGALYLLVTDGTLLTREGVSPWLIVTAGLLVGVGTRLGSGCTSGHGVCGISRLSPRSLVATLSFMATGFAMTAMLRHVLSVSV